VKPPPGSRSTKKNPLDFQGALDIIVFKAETIGVVIEICIKYPGGRTRIKGTEVAPRGQRGNGRRQRQRPLQNGSGGGDRYIERGAAKRAAVTGRARRR
jgi:hypothetical protein